MLVLYVYYWPAFELNSEQHKWHKYSQCTLPTRSQIKLTEAHVVCCSVDKYFACLSYFYCVCVYVCDMLLFHTISYKLIKMNDTERVGTIPGFLMNKDKANWSFSPWSFIDKHDFLFYFEKLVPPKSLVDPHFV